MLRFVAIQIDPNIREMMGMKLKNAVVIFDEVSTIL